jgi:peptidyl-prolyl cis-trans isomerase SurA
MKRLIAALVLALPALAGARVIPVDGVVAVVNDQAIVFSDVMRAVDSERARGSAGARASAEERMAAAYTNALNGMIERKLIVDAYATDDKKLPDDAVDRRVGSVMRDRAKKRGAFMEALNREGLSVGDWKGSVRDRMIMGYMKSRYGEHRGVVSPASVRAAYEADPRKFQTPEKVHLRLIMIQSEPGAGRAALKQAADAARERVAKGADFAAVAEEVSDDSKAKRGGDWGWIEPAMLNEALARAIAGLADGQLSPVLEVKGDFYILRVDGRQAAGAQPLVQVAREIGEGLRKQADEARYAEWIGRLRGRSYVHMTDSGLM